MYTQFFGTYLLSKNYDVENIGTDTDASVNYPEYALKLCEKVKKETKKEDDNMVQEIYIIDDDDSSILIFRELFRNDPEYKFISVKSEQIDVALKNIPSLIIINEENSKKDIIEVCNEIRENEDNS